MKIRTWIPLAVLLCAYAGAAFGEAAPQKIVLQGAEPLAASTPAVFNGDLRALPLAVEWQPGDPTVEIPQPRQPPQLTPSAGEPRLDPLLAVQARTSQDTHNLQSPLLNFNGQGYTGAYPPDPVGDVGIDHYIQIVNSWNGAVFTVYNKSNGSVAAGPIQLAALGKGDCAYGSGQGMVLYDQLADRWLLSQLSYYNAALCVYVSQTSNPVTGGWFAYQFNTTSYYYPYYAKFGVWPDAYYASAYEDAPAVYAFDRTQMLAGGVATAQRFTAPYLAAFGFQALTPADADGDNPPPPGAPNPFMRHRDDEAHNPGANNPAQDFLEIWEFHADFATPANSTFTGPTNIPTAEFDSDLCGLYDPYQCFPQPSGYALDPWPQVIMHRLQYRNFGTHQTLVGNLVTDVDGMDHGGIRWFELRNTGGGWSLYQEGTFAPDAHHRWIGSAAMDSAGNLGIGYSVAGTTSYPSIRFAARWAGDPPGALRGEVSVIEGKVANWSSYWGSYASLNVDPIDDRTFWLTAEYSPASNWGTRIATFHLCDPPAVPVIGSAAAAAPNRIDVTWSNGSPPSDSFNVYRAFGTCASPGPFIEIANSVPGFSFQDTGVSGGSTYAYRVTGLLDQCESGRSGCVEATATGACTLPPSFAGLAGAASQGGTTCGVTLSWTAATPLCAGPVTYDVYRSTSSGFTPGPGNQIATGVTGTSYTDNALLTSGTTYYYVVRAVDTANASGESNSVQRGAVPAGPPGILTETFEGPGGFDNPGWTHSAISGVTDWLLSTDFSQTPTHSWRSPQSYAADRVLVSPPFTPQVGTTLSFWHTYQFEYGYDGGTLEISTDGGGSWSVIPDAAFIAGGFNGTTYTCCSNPIGGKRVWTGGNLGPMTEVKVDLGAFAGSNARLRWHAGEDSSVAYTGWYVDSVTMPSALACSPTPPPPLDFYTVTPCRLVDTRNPAGPSGGPALQPFAQRTFVLAGSCGVPAGAKALSVNLTVTQPDAAGQLILYPADIGGVPVASSINFAGGQTRANNAMVTLAYDGSGGIKVHNASTGTVHFILDVNGYYQ